MYTVVELTLRFAFGGAEQIIHPVLLAQEPLPGQGKELALIDCGYPGSLPQLQAAAQEQGYDLAQLTQVLITHHDYDHMGALAELRRAYPALRVLASQAQEPYVSGREKSLRLVQAEALFASLPQEMREGALRFQHLLERQEGVPVDELLVDGMELGRFADAGAGPESAPRVIATPGHMPGHLSVYLPTAKTLIAGDALVLEQGRLELAHPQYCLDLAEAKRSIATLQGLELERVQCYHGGMFTGNVRAELARLVASF